MTLTAIYPPPQNAQTVDLKDALVTWGFYTAAAGATPLNLDGGAFASGNITVGVGAAATNYSITFDGATNDGSFSWVNASNYFKFDDMVYFESTVGIVSAPVTTAALKVTGYGTVQTTAAYVTSTYAGSAQDGQGVYCLALLGVGRSHTAPVTMGGRFEAQLYDYKNPTNNPVTVIGGTFRVSDLTGTVYDYTGTGRYVLKAGDFYVPTAVGTWGTNNPPVTTYCVYVSDAPTNYGTGHVHYAIYVAGGNSQFNGNITERSSGTNSLSRFTLEGYNDQPTYGPELVIQKSNSDTAGTVAETQDGDELATLQVNGVTSAPAFATGFRIRVMQDGASGAAIVPTSAFFEASTPAAVNSGQLTLLTDGSVGINNLAPTVSLDVTGAVKASTTVTSGTTVTATTNAIVGGSIIQNSVMYQYSGSKVLTDESAISFVDIALAANAAVGGVLDYTITSTDGTDFQCHSANLSFAAVDKAGTLTSDIDETYVAAARTVAVSAGTLTDTFSIVDGVNKISLACNANTSIAGAVITLRWSLRLFGSNTVTAL